MKSRSKSYQYASLGLGNSLEDAVRIIQEGGIVAFPTETSYGLAVDPYNPDALTKLFSLKKRDASKPILILISELKDLTLCVDYIPKQYKSLIEKYWPGPLTLIFPVRGGYFPPQLTAGLDTVAVRLSPHPVARALVGACGGPLTATSANFSGGEPALTAAQCQALFAGDIDYILESEGECKDSFSTIVGVDEADKLICLRQGELDLTEELLQLNGRRV